MFPIENFVFSDLLKKFKFFKFFLFYLPLFFLVILSISSGYIFSDLFLGLGNDFFSKDLYINPLHKQLMFENIFETSFYFKKFFPFLMSLFLLLTFENLNFLLKQNLRFYYFIKLKLYFDFVFNLGVLYSQKFQFQQFLQNLDNGFFELLGPQGFIRYNYWLVRSTANFNKDFIFNYIFFFLFWVPFFMFF